MKAEIGRTNLHSSSYASRQQISMADAYNELIILDY